MYYEKRHPDHPWLTSRANTILDKLIKPTHHGVEFGSGRSTAWFAKRSEKLTSIESDISWYEKVKIMLAEKNLSHVTYHLKVEDEPEESGNKASYVKVLEDFPEQSLNYVLVDGLYRDYCALNAVNKIKAEGMIIIDNVNWYLPSTSYSPNSRKHSDGPKNAVWAQFLEQIDGWETIWTSSGVTDTAIFIKPQTH